MISLGIVGCGWVTESVHLPVLHNLKDIQVYAACDTRDERLQHMKHAFGIPCLYHEWQELVSDPAIDAVLVATPADQHAAIAQGALTAGKHVLVEKPLSLNLPEAQMLAEAAGRSGLVAMVGLNYRFHPLVRRLRGAIERGDLGRPLAMFLTLTSMMDQRKSVSGYETHPNMGGGVFYDKVVHVLDVLRFLFDCEVIDARVGDRFLKLTDYARQMLHIAGTVAYFATTRGRLSSYRGEWEHFIHGVSTRTSTRPNFEDGVAITRTLQQMLASVPEIP